MTEGNATNVVLKKSDILIKRGMGMTLPQLAANYGLSTGQMKMALIDIGAMKAEADDDSDVLTAREQKFLDVCSAHEIEVDKLQTILSDLGMEFKTGRRSTKGGKKYQIIDDLTNNA